MQVGTLRADDEGDSHSGLQLHNPGHFPEPTERIRQLHLPRSPALRLEETRCGDENTGGPRARSRDVQAVRTVQELHAPWRIVGRGSRHGHDYDGRLLALELVDCPDVEAGE